MGNPYCNLKRLGLKNGKAELAEALRPIILRTCSRVSVQKAGSLDFSGTISSGTCIHSCSPCGITSGNGIVLLVQAMNDFIVDRG